MFAATAMTTTTATEVYRGVASKADALRGGNSAARGRGAPLRRGRSPTGGGRTGRGPGAGDGACKSGWSVTNLRGGHGRATSGQGGKSCGDGQEDKLTSYARGWATSPDGGQRRDGIAPRRPISCFVPPASAAVQMRRIRPAVPALSSRGYVGRGRPFASALLRRGGEGDTSRHPNAS